MKNDLLERVIRLFVRELAAGRFEAAERWAQVAFGLQNRERERKRSGLASPGTRHAP
jgi:hypothetical protein